MPDGCFDHCKLKGRKSGQNCLFASEFPVSEYMDNISRIGQMIMKQNLHCHEDCRDKCKHEFMLNLEMDPRSKQICQYRKTNSGAFRSKCQIESQDPGSKGNCHSCRRRPK